MENKQTKFFPGWIVVIAAFIATGASATTCITAFGIFVAPAVKLLNVPVTTFLFCITLVFLFGAIMAPVCGKIVEKKGMQFSMLVGGLILTAGHVILAFAKALPLFYIGYVLVGISSGMVGPVISTTAAARWFTKRRGLAVGIISSGGGFITMLLSPILAKTIMSYGLSAGYWLLAGIDFVAITVVGALFIYNSPQEKGFNPDNAPGPVVTTGASTAPTFGFTLQQALKTPAFWFIGAGMFAYALAALGTAQTHNAAIQALGFDPMLAASVISIVGLVSAFGKMLFGYLMDRFNWKIVTACGFSLFIIAELMIASFKGDTSHTMLYAYAIVFGIAYSFWHPTMIKSISGSFGLKNFPSIFGSIFLIRNFGDMIGPLIGGRFFDTTGSYAGAYIAFVFVMALSCVLFMLVKKPELKEIDAK